MRVALALAAGLVSAAAPAPAASAAAAQSTPSPASPIAQATAADMHAQIAAMERDMKPGQGFAWRPLVQDGKVVAAIEIWRRPGKPAIHPADAEYFTVLQGSGTVVAGGRMTNPQVRNPGQTDGDAIEGGTTRPLRAGDVVLVPAGTPHWFGITGGELVLLGTKIPQGAK